MWGRREKNNKQRKTNNILDTLNVRRSCEEKKLQNRSLYLLLSTSTNNRYFAIGCSKYVVHSLKLSLKLKQKMLTIIELDAVSMSNRSLPEQDNAR